MSATSYDTIIVGARCAGAALAIHLARAGQKVLLLDSARLPSDQPLSTHFVQAYGVDLLDELGVGANVRRASPPSKVLRIDMAGTAVDVPVPRGRAGHCIGRTRLDGWLLETAVRAGAEVHDRCKVTALLRDGDRVAGVATAPAEGGAAGTFHARVVVGADGRNSTIAALTGAEEYLGYKSPRFMYWAYWPTRVDWRADVQRATFDSYIGFDADSTVRFVFQTDGDRLLLSVSPPQTALPSWKGRYREAYLAALQASPVTAALVADQPCPEKLVGLLDARFFLRRAAGPGFALVGDAGLHKDPTPGLGITDALRDARNLAAAVLAGGDEALVHYWRRRDVESIDLFHFAKDFGDPGYVNALNRLVYGRVRSRPDLIARLAASVDRAFSPYEAIPTRQVVAWVAGAVARGRVGVIPSFLRRAVHEIQVQRARQARQRLLRALSASSAPAMAALGRIEAPPSAAPVPGARHGAEGGAA